MRRWTVIGLVSVSITILLVTTQVGRAGRFEKPRVRFAPVHIYLEPGRPGAPGLAAYQFELRATTGRIKIVGVEGGEHAAFKEAPYYDPAALAKDRIIIAAFNTGRDLPQGRTRIATVHLQILGAAEPEYELDLTVAADADGRELPAKLNLERGDVK